MKLNELSKTEHIYVTTMQFKMQNVTAFQNALPVIASQSSPKAATVLNLAQRLAYLLFFNFVYMESYSLFLVRVIHFSLQAESIACRHYPSSDKMELGAVLPCERPMMSQLTSGRVFIWALSRKKSLCILDLN